MTTQGKILLADDERVFLRSTTALLQQEGYECVCASTGSMAMEFLQANGFDLLITDLKMPGNLELEVLQGAARRAAGVPIIVVTAYPSVATALAALHLPVVDYLVKPFDFSQLLTAVRRGLAFASTYRAISHFRQHLQMWRSEAPGLEHWLHLIQRDAAAAVEMLPAFILQNLAERRVESQPPPTQVAAANIAARVSSGLGAEADQWKSALVKIARVLQEVGLPVDTQASSLWIEAFGQASPLSSKERMVLRYMLSGQRVSDIARTLSLSRHTVRNHLRSIFRKLNVHSQNELLAAFAPRFHKDL